MTTGSIINPIVGFTLYSQVVLAPGAISPLDAFGSEMKEEREVAFASGGLAEPRVLAAARVPLPRCKVPVGTKLVAQKDESVEVSAACRLQAQLLFLMCAQFKVGALGPEVLPTVKLPSI